MEEFHRIPIVIRDDLSDEDDGSGNVRDASRRVGLIGGVLRMAERIINDSGVSVRENVIDEESGVVKEDSSSCFADNDECDPFDLVERLKEEGSRHYLGRNYDLALREYLKAKSILEIEIKVFNDKATTLGDFNGERQADFLLSMFVLESNCIACYIGKKDYNKSIVESKRVLTCMSLKREGLNKMGVKLPTLWRNVENKVRYRYSLAIFSLYGDDIGRRNEQAESFELLSCVYDYYYKELMVEPPKELLTLYLNLKKIVESCNIENKSVCDSKKSEELSENELKNDYLRLYIETYYKTGTEEVGYKTSDLRTQTFPTGIVNKLPYNTNMDFIRIWQNISHRDQWIDYFIIYSELESKPQPNTGGGLERNRNGYVFEGIDKLFEKTELEPVILEKILERISAILDKAIEISTESDSSGESSRSVNTAINNRKVVFIDNILGLIRKLTKTYKFDFSLMMTSKSGDFRILEKLVVCSEKLMVGEKKTELENDVNSLVNSLRSKGVVF
ncbi:hypothetical protein FG386_001005 [Cryptosporidium ryanae]|uniref:uncharacterized protein n=1 Tax=Cryptosporidium ryanae TaxID=515981 RepID=UPI00351A6948|nr:hypothetical protein FG386_001005 [Cryptosporidium ryanae]